MLTSVEKSGPAKNLGVLIFGRKRPGFDQEWNKTIRERCLGMLTAMGFNCIGSESLVLDDQTIHAAIDRIIGAQCEALVVIQPSISDGQFALTIQQRWGAPVILWATPERADAGKVSSCALVGHHLWASIFRQSHFSFELVYGQPNGDLDEARCDLLRAIALSRAVIRFRRAKIGVVGTHVPGFIDLAADPFLIRQTFGLQLHPLSLPQFIERVGNVAEDAINEDLRQVRLLGLAAGKSSPQTTDALLSVNSRFFLALKELMQEMSLDALALQCWPELPNTLGHWPYLAVSRMTAMGHAVSIEGDVDGAIGGLMGELLGAGPGFLTDWLEHDASTIFFWHPGMAPLDMLDPVGSEQGPTLGEHFNGGRPCVVDGELRKVEDVTVSRLWRCDGRYHMTAFQGRPIPSRRRVTGNSLLIQVGGEPVPARFDRMIHAGMPHHVTVHFGEHAETFRRWARLVGVEWHD